MKVFRRALPLVATSFINKAGAIGLTLLPVLLVERGTSTLRASVVMGAVKAAGPAGVLLGGLWSDRAGVRTVVLVALALQGAALGLLPVAPTLLAIAACGVVARFGEALFQSPARMLLTDRVAFAEQYEAMGWLRSANNAGQLVCFTIGALAAGFGLAPLLWFDSATSLAALTVGSRWLQRGLAPQPRSTPPAEAPRPGSWTPALLVAMAIGAFVCVYELFLVGGAASYRERFGPHGIALFSEAMIVDTVLSAFFAVWAARHLRQPALALPVGGALTALGAALALMPSSSTLPVFAGVLVLTVGEIVFTSRCSTILLQLVPTTSRRGGAYAALLVVQDLGRIAGGALAFPLIVRGAAPVTWLLWLGAGATVMAVVAGRWAERALSSLPVAVAAVP